MSMTVPDPNRPWWNHFSVKVAAAGLLMLALYAAVQDLLLVSAAGLAIGVVLSVVRRQYRLWHFLALMTLVAVVCAAAGYQVRLYEQEQQLRKKMNRLGSLPASRVTGYPRLP